LQLRLELVEKSVGKDQRPSEEKPFIFHPHFLRNFYVFTQNDSFVKPTLMDDAFARSMHTV